MLFSVIIPTYQRQEALYRLLDLLAPGKQLLSCDQYEVIVSNDGSEDYAAIASQKYPFVKWVTGPKLGPAANRNNGAKVAQGEWLVFTDDDCLVDPNWLNSYAAHVNAGAQAMEGPIAAMEKMDKVFSECPVNIGGAFWSANIAVKKTLFDQVGGFDERFPYPAHEDLDLRERILPFTKILSVAQAKIQHPVRVMTLKEMLGLTYKRCFSWTYFEWKQGRISGPFTYFLFVFGWMRIWLTYLWLYTRTGSPRGVFLSLLSMFVLGPVIIFKALYLSDICKKVSATK